MENETANTPTEDTTTQAGAAEGQQPKAAAATSNLSATETVDIPIGAPQDDEEEKKEETKESTSDIEETKTAATTASEASDNNLSA